MIQQVLMWDTATLLSTLWHVFSRLNAPKLRSASADEHGQTISNRTSFSTSENIELISMDTFRRISAASLYWWYVFGELAIAAKRAAEQSRCHQFQHRLDLSCHQDAFQLAIGLQTYTIGEPLCQTWCSCINELKALRLVVISDIYSLRSTSKPSWGPEAYDFLAMLKASVPTMLHQDFT